MYTEKYWNTSQTGKKITISEKEGRDSGSEECEAIDGRMMRCASYRRKFSLCRRWKRRGIMVERGELFDTGVTEYGANVF
jgi:hypothetical protein